jgi:hypothetical protein
VTFIAKALFLESTNDTMVGNMTWDGIVFVHIYGGKNGTVVLYRLKKVPDRRE